MQYQLILWLIPTNIKSELVFIILFPFTKSRVSDRQKQRFPGQPPANLIVSKG